MMPDASGAPLIAYWRGTLNAIRETAPGVWTPLGGAIDNQPADFNGAASFGVHVDAGGTVRASWIEGVRTSGASPWADFDSSW